MASLHDVKPVVTAPVQRLADDLKALAVPPECAECAQHHAQLESAGKDRHYAGCKCGWQHGASFPSERAAGISYGKHLGDVTHADCPVDAWLDARS